MKEIEEKFGCETSEAVAAELAPELLPSSAAKYLPSEVAGGASWDAETAISSRSNPVRPSNVYLACPSN